MQGASLMPFQCKLQTCGCTYMVSNFLQTWMNTWEKAVAVYALLSWTKKTIKTSLLTPHEFLQTHMLVFARLANSTDHPQ